MLKYGGVNLFTDSRILWWECGDKCCEHTHRCSSLSLGVTAGGLQCESGDEPLHVWGDCGDTRAAECYSVNLGVPRFT